MSEEKKCKKSMKKTIDKNEHKCTCDPNVGCLTKEDEVPYKDLIKTLDMPNILCLLEDYCSVSGKTFDDIATAIAEEKHSKNEKLFIDMAEKIEDAIKTFMQNSTDSAETKNMLLKEMFSKLTSLYISSALNNKIDEWKKAQNNIGSSIKDKLDACKQQDPKVLFKSIEDIFPWMKNEASDNTEDEEDKEDDGDSEYLIDLDFPFTYKDEERNIEINADIIGESNDSIDIQIETEYEDRNMCISHITETSYDRDEKLSKFFEDCMESINDLYKTKNSCCNFN